MGRDEIHVAAVRGVDGEAGLVEGAEPVETGERAGGAGVGDEPFAAVRGAEGRDLVVVCAGGVRWGDVAAAAGGGVVGFVEGEEVGG